jgi:hypothetical protein
MINNELCKICQEEIAEGSLQEYGICPVCGDIVDDIIARYFEMVARNCSEGKTGLTHDAILKYFSEVLGWVQHFEELEGFSSDEKYYQRFKMVLDWFEKNMDTFERIIEEKLGECSECGVDFSEYCLRVEKMGEWLMVSCGNCNETISKHYLHKEEI